MEDNRNARVIVSVAVTKAHSSDQVSVHELEALLALRTRFRRL